MSKFVQLLKQAKLTDRVFDERQLAEVLPGSEASRYGLVNRALKNGSLVRIRRGLYALAPEYRSEPIHPFAVAQAILPGSYISFESALAFHGWIPEAVPTTASTSPNRKTLTYDTPLGRFGFHPLAINDYQFMVGVERHRLGGQTAFVASPLRALFDLVALRKVGWTGLSWVTEGLRIDPADLVASDSDGLAELVQVYRHKAAQDFVQKLSIEVETLKSENRGHDHD